MISHIPKLSTQIERPEHKVLRPVKGGQSLKDLYDRLAGEATLFSSCISKKVPAPEEVSN